VLFVLLGAPFIGTLQVLVYTGAIVVLFRFVVMLLNLQRESRTARSTGPQKIAALLGALGFAAVAGVAVWRSSGDTANPPLTEAFVDVKAFAAELFSEYLLTFEIVGVLLLVAVIAAYIIAKRPEPTDSGVATTAPPREDA
jgi:NADH-quinone oxidoreductase subunit J